eukprot:s781_g20.t2
MSFICVRAACRCPILVHSRRGYAAEPVLSQLSRVVSAQGTGALEQLHASHPDAAEQRRELLRRLGAEDDSKKPEAIREALDALEDDHSLVRLAGIHALARVAESSYWQAVAAMATDPDELVRVAAMRALGRMAEPGGRDAEALEFLDKAEKEAKDRSVRGAARDAAARLRGQFSSKQIEAAPLAFWPCGSQVSALRSKLHITAMARRPSTEGQGRRSSARAALLLLTLGLAPGFLVPEAPQGALPRRSLLAAATGLLAPLQAPQTARAEQGWQLKLPRTWRTFEQNAQPPPEVKKATALVVAGNPEQGGELVVLRVPLSLDPKDPNAKGNKDLVSYFTSGVDKKPSVPTAKAAEVVTSSQKTAPGLIKWNFLEQPAEKVIYGRRYLKYDYEASICPGVVTKGSKGDTCMAIEDTSELPLYERRHRILLTVTDEGATARGEKDPTYYIWLLDISGPAQEARDNWGSLKEAVTEVADSFVISEDEKTLEKARTAEGPCLRRSSEAAKRSHGVHNSSARSNDLLSRAVKRWASSTRYPWLAKSLAFYLAKCGAAWINAIYFRN